MMDGPVPAAVFASTGRVVRAWPLVPFWLRRRAGREIHMALPGAALSAAAIAAVLLAEPSLYRPGLQLFPLYLPAFSLELFSVLAPLATAAMLADRRAPADPLWRWAGWLPVGGLFAVAHALARLD